MGKKIGKRKRDPAVNGESDGDDEANHVDPVEQDDEVQEAEEEEQEVAEFGFEEEATPLGGRRKKMLREQRKKLKPGTFGASTWMPGCVIVCVCV
jgi:hypothetical protein